MLEKFLQLQALCSKSRMQGKLRLQVVVALAELGKDVHSKDLHGFLPPMHQALLQDGALPNACVERDGDDCTPLYLAVAGGHVSTAKVLISFGADVNLACSMGQAPTPLHIAVSRDAVELVEILLASGADVNAPYKRSPVHLAFARGHQEVLAAILRVPSVDVKSPAAENWTVLHISAEKGHAAPVKMILDKDVDAVNARSSNNSTPLHLAARHGHQHIVQLLVETGRLDIDAVARDNFTPMLNAVHGNHMHTVQYLLGKGANAKARLKSKGTTALHIVSERLLYVNVDEEVLRNYVEIFKTLLSAGADANVQTIDTYDTPLPRLEVPSNRRFTASESIVTCPTAPPTTADAY
eukprot:gene1602-2239_t